jgi:hypothetical protein
MTLDMRATRATRSINIASAAAVPIGMKAVAGRRRRSFGAGVVGALAVLFASVALASTLPVFSPSEVAHSPDVIVPDETLTIGEPHLHSATSDSPTPYAVFSGLADPGTVVSAASDFGSANLVVGDSGEWTLKLFFTGPPPGVEFPIVMTVGDQVFTFGFTSLWDPANIDITASQTYGASHKAEPFEKFFGTAPPGTAITAVSEYGSAGTAASDEGKWSLALWFQGLPEGAQEFPVTVTVGDEVFDFTFKWLFEPAADEVETKVSQVGTSSNSKTPYTQFIGTAPKGTHVVATSEYGSADLEVGASGEFSLKVWFSNPPAGVKFPITVKIDGAVYGEYHFTSTYTPPAETGDVTVIQYNTESYDSSPYAKFYGTAPKGTTIQLISEYGSASMTTGGGDWLLKVWFDSLPPAGVKFPITVKVNGSVHGTYNFTSHFDGEYDLTVNQHNTESYDSNPYVKFYGTAPLGTQIQIVSPYGSTSMTTDHPDWHLKLFFSSLPPAGEPFQVTVKVNGGVHGTYNFTSWYEVDDTPVTVGHASDSSAADPPFDDLWGTAPAGTQVKIISDYGSTTLTVGESGEWTKRQYFEGAPYGVAFTVTVKVNGQVKLEYSFTVNAP